MIEFATLFLGLVLGVQEVEVMVGEDVAAVEILVNGASAGTLTEEPWKLRCDFGDELAPQQLTAVARDRDGREIGRSTQLLNLPQPPARVTVTLEGGENGEPRMARLSWESRAGDRPQALSVSFDGVPLEVDDPRAILLPPHDSRQLHFLRAELEFSDHVVSEAEVAFGGTYADQVATELTAVPVVGRKGKVKKEGALDGLLLAHGEPLRPVAVEKESAQIVFVPEVAVRDALEEVSRLGAYEGLPMGAKAHRLRGRVRLDSDSFASFLWPVVEHRKGTRQSYDLFPTSRQFSGRGSGLFFLLYSFLEEAEGGVERLADAVAVAGLHAAGQRQRRAVVLLVDGEDDEDDPSQLTPAQVRGYLERLRVPLEVWSLGPGTDAGPWGKAVDASTIDSMEDALGSLERRLGRQWIVWVDGVYLPQEIALAPETKGVELVR